MAGCVINTDHPETDMTANRSPRLQRVTMSFRLLVFRILLPLVCLLGLFGILTLIYQGSSQPDELVEAPSLSPESETPTYESLKGQYMEMVRGGLSTLQNFDGSRYRGNADLVSRQLLVFQSWAILINEKDKYPLDDQETKDVRLLASRLSTLQQREFPIMRAEWARTIRHKLLPVRTIISSTGERNRFLHLTVLPGTDENGVNKCFDILMSEDSAHLRFSRIEFTFSLGQTVTAPVTPTRNTPPADKELVFWQGNFYEIVNWLD
jgi:hypothetical protein